MASAHLRRITPGIPVEEYANVSFCGDDDAFATVEVAYTYPADAADVVWNVSDGTTYVTYRDGATRIITEEGIEERGGHSVPGLYQDFRQEYVARIPRGASSPRYHRRYAPRHGAGGCLLR